jgi:hypothetical protein
MMRARWSVVVVLALAVAGAPRASAQSASAQAQSLFDDGRKLMKAGKTVEACAAFESSQKLDPAVTTLLNLADCREVNQQLATAWGLFGDANRLARTTNNDKLARVASNHVQKLAPRLSKLTITVAADRKVAGLQVLRGTDVVDPAGWNHALPVDGGTYTITARAPGYTAFTISKTIKIEGDNQAVEIPALVAAPPPPEVSRTTPPADVTQPAGPATPATRPAAPDVAATEPRASGSNLAPIVLGAGAVVLGGAAVVFELSGDSKYDAAKKVTDDQKQRDALESSANTRRYVAEALGIAAVGCAGVAVYLYVHGRGERHPPATALTPIASPQLAGLALTGRW